MGANVRLKFKDRQRKASREEITSLAFGKLKVPFTRLFPIPEGFKAICRNDVDVDKILSKESRTEFNKIGIDVQMPPEIKAKRTVFARQLDYEVGKHSPEEFKAELEDKNNWMRITEVVKIKNYTHIIKIVMEDTSMADKALQGGFVMFNMAITAAQIKREEFISLLTCFTCYRHEHHTTRDCPEKGRIMCSECGQSGHSFRECTNDQKSCLNCLRTGNTNNNHRTLAMACPIKKQLIQNKVEMKKKEAEDKQNSTYAEIAKKTVQEIKQKENKTHIYLSEQKHNKLLISIMHAHIINLGTPGTYQQELNRMLTENGLPAMWFPENPDSQAILGATVLNENDQQPILGATALIHNDTQEDDNETSDEEEEEEEEDEETQMKIERDPRIRQQLLRNVQERRTQENINQHTKTSADEMNDEPMPEILPSTEELGLTIYTTNKHNYPTRKPDRHNIATGIDNQTHKYTYNNTDYKEENVQFYLKQGLLELTKDIFKITDESSFKNIKNGQIKTNKPNKKKHNVRKH